MEQTLKENKVRFESADHNDYRGWAWSPTDASAPERPAFVIKCGLTTLGRRRRTVPRADVDKHTGDFIGEKGFTLPIVPLGILGQVVGDPVRFAPAVQFADKMVEVPKLLYDASMFRTLLLADDNGPFRVADVFFASSHDFRLRLEATASKPMAPIYIRFYQPRLEPGDGIALQLVHEQSENRLELSFASVPLINPFLPLLIVVTSADDEILACDVLPYPSLCRGGLHAAELAACGLPGSTLADLRVLSDSLVREFIGWGGSPPLSVGRILIDAFAATGAEPIFGKCMLEWLSRTFCIEMKLANAERTKLHELTDSVFAEHLQAKLEPAMPAQPGARGQVQLAIPSRGVPTISALVSRRLAEYAGGKAAPATFLVADGGTAKPKWLVSLPPANGLLDRLQPATAPNAYPTLSVMSVEEAAQEAGRPLAVPVAILFHEPPSQDAELRLFPIPQDYQGTPLRTASLRGDDLHEQTVSIVVTVRERDRRFEIFLESAARQSAAQRFEVIVVSNRTAESFEASIRAALDRIFPGVYKLIHYDDVFNHSAQINLGMAHASGRYAVIANSSVVLHDTRTIDVLLQLASEPRIATASCMLLHRPADRRDIAFRSAGYFPGSIDFLAEPHIHFVEPDCREALPFATFPVAANSLDLMALRAELWPAIGGLDERNFPSSHNDVDFALRASKLDMLHVCTTAVSAYCERRRTRGTLTDVPASSLLQAASLADILARAAVLRRL